MVKKLQKMAAKKNSASNTGFGGALPAGLLDSQLAQGIKDSAQHIWAAGLGAFAKAQGEGGKVFEALVKEGLSLQKKTQSAAEEKLGAMASKAASMAGGVGNKAGQHWDKLESIFEDRVARALNRLGVPSAKDVAELIASIDALNAAVGIKQAPVKKPVKTATKTAAKTAAAVKPAAKPVAKVANKKVAAKAKPAAKAAAKAAAKTVATPFKKVTSKAVAATPPVVVKPAAKRAPKVAATGPTAAPTAAPAKAARKPASKKAAAKAAAVSDVAPAAEAVTATVEA